MRDSQFAENHMKYLNVLNKIDGLGCKKMKLLMNFFQSPEKIWNASADKLAASGIGEALARKISEERNNIDPDAEWAKTEKENVIVTTVQDDAYPALLKQIPDNPYIIYMKGNVDCLKLPMVAVVGSRKITEYGKQAAYAFAKDLANSGICVVSGLAFGVDAIAHQGALDAKGKTIAVVGNSLDVESIYPRSNFQLAHEIIESGGLLLSEFPIQTRAANWTFPARNRIMAGMSLGTIVVEAAEKSGSLITANLALDYNREVFAVPGSIFSPQSEGTHKLIKMGAKLAACSADILEELKIEETKQTQIEMADLELSEEEKNILEVLSHESVYIDRISKLTKLETATISSALAILEIKGLVKNIGGQQYIRL